MRIRIPLSEIASLSSRLKAVSVELENSRQILSKATGRLDWEVSRRPEVDSLINKALTASQRLSNEGFRLSLYLKKVESRFQEADSTCRFNFKESSASLVSQNEGTFAAGSAVINASQVNSQTIIVRNLDIMNTSPSNYVQSLSWINGVVINR